MAPQTEHLEDRALRGQALLGPGGIAKIVRFDPVALRRIRATTSQTGLDRRERVRNVRGAFRGRRGWRAPGRVWLVDDVVTTRSTLEEAARALRRAGAKDVRAVCAARTL